MLKHLCPCLCAVQGEELDEDSDDEGGRQNMAEKYVGVNVSMLLLSHCGMLHHYVALLNMQTVLVCGGFSIDAHPVLSWLTTLAAHWRPCALRPLCVP